MTSPNSSTADYDMAFYRDMTKGWNDKPLSHLERYYTKYINDRQPHLYLRQAPNGIMVLGVRSIPGDAQTGSPTVELAFDLVGEKITPGSMIAKINDEPIYAKVHGKLLEVNERLITEPDLLLTDPTVQGHLAVIMPKNSDKKIHEFHPVDVL
ncbi:hypothetical protein [Absidia glauca]|uniref:Protein Abitram n=1 Tax=Absidia glauca TaxID=4829 RepID=A0A163JTJ1_ABSGL|nr:hypothetical protein [Absidia glauca]